MISTLIPVVDTTETAQRPTVGIVCEGSCNPPGVVSQFDAIVRASERRPVIEATDEEFPRTITTIPDEWLDRARQFVHTLHVRVARDRYACVVCGTSRRYGNTEK